MHDGHTTDLFTSISGIYSTLATTLFYPETQSLRCLQFEAPNSERVLNQADVREILGKT